MPRKSYPITIVDKVKKIYLIFLGLLFAHLLILANIRFTAWPEMLSYPYLFSHGFTLYKDFVYPYPPLLVVVLSWLYSAFGYKLSVLQLFTWLIILMSDVLIVGIVEKLTKKWTIAMAALALYVFTQPFLEGNQLWFDLALVPLMLTAIYFIFQKKTAKNLIIAGVFMGLSVLVKQTSGLFLLAIGLYMLVVEKTFKKIIYLAIGPVIIGASLLVWLIREQILGYFVNWNLIYPFTFWSKFPGYVQMNLTNGQMLVLGVLLFPLFVIVAKNFKTTSKDKNLLLLEIILLISLIMVYPRFSFFHFQMALAAIAVTFGYLLSKYKFSPVLHALFWIFILFVIALPVFKRDIGVAARFWDQDTLSFSQKLKEETKGKSTFLLGLPSSIYVFSGSHPPKPWIDNYGWYFEIPGVQESTIADWNANKPDYVVTSDPEGGNWYDLGVYRPKQVMNWIEKGYVKREQLAKGVWLWQMK